MTVEGQHDLMDHVTTFYKGLFGHSVSSSIDANFVFENQVPSEINEEMVKGFSLEDIKELVFSVDHNKANGQMISQ